MNKLTPDNNGTGKVDQREVVLSLLFKADEKRVGDFNYPTSGLEVRITLYFFALLAFGTDMSRILACLNGKGTSCITSI